ncbi:MAG TPA: transporter [Stellaceae bacterium]|nr:transporter [Stellaceae bacterium]
MFIKSPKTAGTRSASLAASSMVAGALLTVGWCDVAAADDPAPDKSGYTLFNPTPTDQMRAFSTDRPNKSSSPYTVDAGHFQYETDLFNETYDHWSKGGVSTKSFQFADPVLKLGITNDIDFELGLTGYAYTKSVSRSTSTVLNKAQGFGDIVPRVKVNVLGNDSGDIAVALIPYVKIPTGARNLGNNQVEGGLVIPVGFNLPYDFSAVAMTEFDALKNANDSGKRVNFTNLVNVSHTIYGDLTGSVELASAVGTDSGTPAVYTFDVALSYLLTPTLQIDIASYTGLNRAAPDQNVYFGISQRF